MIQKVNHQEIIINTPDDLEKLPQTEREKWEIAEELGLFDQIVAKGWKSLTSKESGRIGGILSRRHHHN